MGCGQRACPLAVWGWVRTQQVPCCRPPWPHCWLCALSGPSKRTFRGNTIKLGHCREKRSAWNQSLPSHRRLQCQPERESLRGSLRPRGGGSAHRLGPRNRAPGLTGALLARRLFRKHGRTLTPILCFQGAPPREGHCTQPGGAEAHQSFRGTAHGERASPRQQWAAGNLAMKAGLVPVGRQPSGLR